MKESTKRLLRGLSLAAGALGAVAFLAKSKLQAKQQSVSKNPRSVWARPGMKVTFRGELMPGKDREERTFRIKQLLSSGRVLLEGVAGEHVEKEFEAIQ